MSSQAIASKAIGLFTQLTLAALLVPDDFGLVALVLTVVAFTSILQSSGTRQVLVHHQATLEDWTASAFWLSLAQGVAAAIILIVATPIAVRFYGTSSIAPLLTVAAITAPIASLQSVPEARLQVAMRWRYLATTELAVSLTQALTAIGLALNGAGAMSIVLAMLVSSATRTALLWFGSPRGIGRGSLWRWKPLLKDSAALLTAFLSFAVTGQAAAISLGIVASVETVGMYYFAYNLSIQAVTLLTGRLQVVLLPTLSSVADDPERQVAATRRTTRALALVTFPAYAILAIVARPLVTLLYSDKWDEAIPLITILAVAMVARSVSPPAGILLMSQGRFRAYMWNHVASAAAFLVAVVPAAAQYGATGAATAVAVHACAAFTLAWTVALHRRADRVRDIVGDLAPILLAAAAAAGAGAVLAGIRELSNAAEVVVAGLGSLGAYTLLVRRVARVASRDAIGQVRSLLVRRPSGSS